MRELREGELAVISVYTPTAGAPRGIKTKFMEDLWDAVESHKIPQSHVLLLLLDVNANVGCGIGL